MARKTKKSEKLEEPIQPSPAPIEVPDFQEEPTQETVQTSPVQETSEADKEKISNLEAMVENLQQEIVQLENVNQILCDRFDKKCAEFDQLMESYISIRKKLGMARDGRMTPNSPSPINMGPPPMMESTLKSASNKFWN